MTPLFRRTTVVLAFGIASALTAAHAQTLPQRKPGLWEVKIQMQGMLAEMQKQMQAALDGMNPAQRKQLEQMMKQQGMADLSGPHRYCLTPEQAAREALASPDPELDCTHKLSPVSSSEAKFSFSCTGRDGKTTGTGRIWNMSPERYQMEMTMKGNTPAGPQEMQMEHSARWLGSDCKGTKPMQ
ncbi:MAG: DUF3617 domain-containing protein [Burkholderiaceae bacterium]|nr:DUF3617 domain-containing protein [Burkholderiaceae bacterium]